MIVFMIDEFRGEYAFLSNFYSAKVPYEGMTYPTAEHAFQAAKTTNKDLRLWISQLPSPGKAKRAGRTLMLRPGWGAIKIDVMTAIVRAKFIVNQDLARRLEDTFDHLLVEGNWWGDRFWGVCQGEGENWLGKILMKVREELRVSQELTE